MRLTNKIISILRKVLLGSAFIILIVTFVQLALIGKNLTFTTRFTPLQSEQNHLRNQTFITQVQALLVVFSIFYIFLVPITVYISGKKSKRIFLPLLLTFNVTSGLLVFLNIYFLMGAHTYRTLMNEKYEDIVLGSTVCNNQNTSICLIGTCTRLKVFNDATSMSIAFAVLNSIFSLVLTATSMLCNQKRKDSDKLELIV